MSKNKPKETIEYVIRLQDKERMLLDEFMFSYRLQAANPAAIIGLLKDPTELIQLLYSLAIIAELFGFDTPLPTPSDLPAFINFLQNKGLKQDQPKSESNPSILELLQKLWLGELGGFPGGY